MKNKSELVSELLVTWCMWVFNYEPHMLHYYPLIEVDIYDMGIVESCKEGENH